MTLNMTPIPIEIRSNYEFGIHGVEHGANYRRFPLRFSVPTAEGAISPEQRFEIRDATGKLIPSLIRPFIQWPAGSARAWEVWLPLDLDLTTQQDYVMQVAAEESSPLSATVSALPVPIQFRITVTLQDGEQVTGDILLDDAAPRTSVHEEEQPFELVQEGTLLFKGTLQLRRWSFYPGAELALRLTQWSSDETMIVKAVRLEFELPLEGDIRYTVQQSFYSRNRDVPLPRYVQSSNPFVLRANHGGVSVTDIAQLDEDPSQYPLYERFGIAAVAPWLAAGDEDSSWLLILDEACERFPKQWSIEGNKVIIDLHPDDACPLEWRQGMSMFQRIHLVRFPAGADGDAFENEAMAWKRPPLVRIEAEQYRAAGWRIPFVHQPARFPKIETRFRELFRFPWYPGTFYWGDESDDISVGEYLALPPEERQRARPRNGEYDITSTSAKEFARTGRSEFLRLCRNAAEHMMYTDFVAVSNDPWKEGGVPAHTRSHTSGACYPSHMWIEGLTLYYQLTGDPYALIVARRIGDFEVKYINERLEDTLLATPREGGWALISLCALYDITREPRYLAAIQRLVDAYINLTPTRFFPTYGSFMVGIGIIGLDRARPFYRDADLQKFICGVLDWQIENRMSPEGLFYYHYDSEKEGAWHVQAGMPEALNIGYLISGNERYLNIAWRQFEFWEAGTLFHILGSDPLLKDSRLASAAHMSWMGCLQTFAEKGWLDQAQFTRKI